MEIKIEEIRSDLARKIADISGADPAKCYQCGKCSAGCPMAQHMDILPHQLVRLIQIGKIEEVLDSNTPWICAACLTCSVRCPRGIRIAEIMEAVRQVVIRKRDAKRRLDLPGEKREELPPIAIISAYRKIVE